MNFQIALANLYSTYSKYGVSKEFLSEQLKDGIMGHGFSVNAAYSGLRMILAQETGEHELFSIEDVMEITGESREWVVSQVEQSREELIAAGQNPDDYFKQVEKSVFYFPGGMTDLTS